MKGFAIYRLPGTDACRLVAGEAEKLDGIGATGGKRGFVMAPFRLSEAHPAILIRPETVLTDPGEISRALRDFGAYSCTDAGRSAQTTADCGEMKQNARTTADCRDAGQNARTTADCGEMKRNAPTADDEGRESYFEAFSRFIGPVRSGRFAKLVLSHSAVLRVPGREVFPAADSPVPCGNSSGLSGGFSPAVVFERACRAYPDMFTYLCSTPCGGTWLGSTPEILLCGAEGQWRTMALAGTMRAEDVLPVADGTARNGMPGRTEAEEQKRGVKKTDADIERGKRAEAARETAEAAREAAKRAGWSEKNIEEQAFVAGYIRDILGRCAGRVSETGPCTSRAGHLCHLRTDFRFAPDGADWLGKLLEELHPTPAVCGLPKREALEFIAENEGYDREYYSGFAGPLDMGGRTDLFVNLRCMKICGGTVRLFAGGGLLPASDADSEWDEIRMKMATVGRLL